MKSSLYIKENNLHESREILWVVFAYNPFCRLGGEVLFSFDFEVPSWTRIHPKGVLACFRAEISDLLGAFLVTLPLLT
jgi:hypothetical protein